MSGYQAAARAAAVKFMKDYAASAGVKMTVYPGRPLTMEQLPRGFVDAIDETLTDFAGTLGTHNLKVTVTLVWGEFDSLEAVTQRDAFVDGFYDWIRTRYHDMRANSLIAPVAVNDIPAYVPDWLPRDQTKVYYATQVTLEGYGTD